MSAEIVKFPGITKLDLHADDVLRGAIGTVDRVVICGFTKDGQEYFAANFSDAGEAFYHLERAKHRLNSTIDGMTDGL